MGGTTPLGFDVRERKLVINRGEAENVRGIYRRYRELGSVRLLKQDLEQRGIVSKIRVSRSGRTSGGCPFSRGALYELLSNPIYIGEIRHRKVRHAGQHEAILDRGVWDKVQDQLRDSAVRGSEPKSNAGPSPLAGKLFDENNEPLYACGAAKNGRRYRYYVSRRLVRCSAVEAGAGWRLAGPEIERSVVTSICFMLQRRSGDRRGSGACRALHSRDSGDPHGCGSCRKRIWIPKWVSPEHPRLGQSHWAAAGWNGNTNRSRPPTCA